ncbi:MAG: TonB-dependent receptor [Bryobacterales bacterium]|nr:TonB-dependent receptor [Bryobacterales bacterium]
MFPLRIAILLLSAFVGLAQEFRATLRGAITDPSNAAIPGAAVTLRNLDTGVERSDAADSAGNYLFSFVAPGRYSLTATAQGFKTYKQDEISLSLNQVARLDVQLQLGAAADTISVTADVSMVQPDSSSLGTVIGSKIVDTLPMKGHSSFLMFNLATGVTTNRYGGDGRPNDWSTNMLFPPNGAPLGTSDASVDGIPNTLDFNHGTGLSAWVPATESVAEFKLLMGTLPAEYGRSGGSIMNVVIKSGTNALHGSLYDYLRNSALDANLFFSRGRGQKLAAFAANTFGVGVGGPVLLPKLYDGRNRTFFYANYEGVREGNGLNNTNNVPTDKMRAGNFSEVGSPIYDPFSVQTADGAPVRTPFPGNIIPVSVQDPVARKIMTYYPASNSVGPNPSTPWVQNFVFSAKWPRNYNMLVTKFDHQLSSRHQTFARLNYGTARLVYPFQFNGIATPGGNINNRPHFGIGVGDTFSISPDKVWDFRLGYTRGIERFRPFSDGFKLSDLGFPASLQSLAQSPAFPTVSVTGFQGLAGSYYKEDPSDTWSLQSSISMHRGSHLFKIGIDARLIRLNIFENYAPSSTFSFGPVSTGGPRADTPVSSSGFSMASLLVGYGSGSIDTNTAVSMQNRYYGIYIQDDYRVTPKFTLNIGLRYEYQSPRTERYDRTTRGFDAAAASPLRVPGLNLRGGLLYAGVGGQSRGLYDPDYQNLGPRIGFAYTVTSNTVLRGGYALSYIPVLTPVSPTGFSVTTPWVSSTDGITPKDLLRNPFPNGVLPAPGSSQGLATLTGQAVSFVSPGDRTPMYHNWQLNVQRSLPSRMLFEMAYVGSRSIRIFGGSDYLPVLSEQLNQLDPGYYSLGTGLLEPVPNPFHGLITAGPLSGPTVQRQQLLRPYPQFTNVTRQAAAFGNGIYHSLQLRVEKRTAHGVTAVVAYTYSKNISDINIAQNAYDRKAERAVNGFDVPQRLTASVNWDLPFGKGRHFLQSASGILDHAIGGWALTSMSTFQSGFPLRFGLASPNLYIAGTGSQRPNVVGDPFAGINGSISSRLGRYFNTSAFAQPAPFTFGNASPLISSIRSPGMNNIDLTLSKNFRVTERARVEFRASSYNFLNHPVFSSPDTTLGNATFGRISGQANMSRQTEFALKLVF